MSDLQRALEENAKTGGDVRAEIETVRVFQCHSLYFVV
jgi:hypothetical protein